LSLFAWDSIAGSIGPVEVAGEEGRITFAASGQPAAAPSCPRHCGGRAASARSAKAPSRSAAGAAGGGAPRGGGGRGHAVPVILDRRGEGNVPAAQVGHGPFDVVAVERDVVGAGVAGILDRVDTQVSLGEIEDPPALADVGAGKPDRLLEELPGRVRIAGV